MTGLLRPRVSVCVSGTLLVPGTDTSHRHGTTTNRRVSSDSVKGKRRKGDVRV